MVEVMMIGLAVSGLCLGLCAASGAMWLLEKLWPGSVDRLERLIFG